MQFGDTGLRSLALAWTALLLASTFTIPAQTLTGGTTGGKARFSPDGLRLL